MEVFRLYHQHCWSEQDKEATDPIMGTVRGKARYKKIRRRLRYMDNYVAQHMHYPTEFEERDNFSSDHEPLIVPTEPVIPKYRHVVPGDFILTFHIIALANSLESQFPHRSEYWWTLLPGTLDQACICLSMQQWVDELKTCKDEESFLTAFQSFLDTTWEAFEERRQITDTFPYVYPTQEELRIAYFMKNRALMLHDRLVWGPGADEDKPKAPSKQQESKSKQSHESSSAVVDPTGSSAQQTEGDGDDEDPNKKKPSETSQGKGDESQDPEKKEEEKEASVDKPQSSAEKEAQDKIDNLMQQLKEARDAKAKAEKAAQETARQAAEEKALRTGEELAQEVDDEKAAKERKREASREKKRKKKKKKGETSVEGAPAPDDEGESEPSEGEEDKPEGDKSKDKKPKTDEPPKDKPEGEDEGKEGPIKDEEPTEPWIEVMRRAAKPRQHTSTAAEKARARTYPRPMCEPNAQGEYTYSPQHVPTREVFTSGKWSVVEKTKDIPPTRNPMKLKENPHKAIFEHGIRRRYTDYKVCILQLQVLEAGKQTPLPESPFVIGWR